MLTRMRQDVPELTDARRFRAAREKSASLGLGHGNPAVLAAYEEHRRVHDGD